MRNTDTHHLMKESILQEYKELLSFQTISSNSKASGNMQACAKWLLLHLKKIGMHKVFVYQTPQHPIVYAEWITNPSHRSVLFYAHYDVQPPGAPENWESPPFQPTIKKSYMYARGASDDKGQLFIHLKSIEYILKNKIPVGVNIKCLFEGEEEIGSPNLKNFILKNKENIISDVVVVSDTKMLSSNTPAITYSLRGSLNIELIVKGRNKEVHSGTFGGMIQNPLDVVSRIVAQINNSQGEILIPGFYDTFQKTSSQERAFMKNQGPADDMLLKDAGIKKNWGEQNWTNYERTTIRPAVIVTTLAGGYLGEGIKNIIPAFASTKINMRLVKNQQPEMIASLFANYIKQQIPARFSYSLTFSSQISPVEIPRNHPYMKAAAQAYFKGFNKHPVWIRSGGTVPVVSLFTNELHIPVLLMGFALGSDNMHAVNEKFYLPNLFRGITTIVTLLQNLSKL